MATKIQKLQGKAEEVAAELASTHKQLGAARKAFQTDETNALIDDRPVDSKLIKRLAELEARADEIEGRRGAIGRAITELSQREVSEREQRQHDAREALKKLVSPEVARMRKAAYELRNGVQALFEVLEKPEHVPLQAHDLADMLFPPADSRDRGADHEKRTFQLEMVNSAIAWIRDDAMHSRTGPQKP